MPPRARRLCFEDMTMPLRAQRLYFEDRKVPLRTQRPYFEDRKVPLGAQRLYFEDRNAPLRAQRCYFEDRKVPLNPQRCYCEDAGNRGMLTGVYCSALEKILLCRGEFTAPHWNNLRKVLGFSGIILYLCRHKFTFLTPNIYE